MILSFYDNKKNGPIVLFIHGTASTNDIWKEQYKVLNKSNYRIIGIDLRGHGKSINPGGLCTIQEHINDLKETLDYIKINDSITIIGHSFGAVLATRFAEKYPEKVCRLLLVSLPAKIPELLIKYYKWFLGKPIEYLKKKLNLILKLPIKKRYKVAISTDLNIVRDILKDSLKWDFLSQVPRVYCPVYLSVGRFDYVALRSIVKRLHNELPNSNYKVFNWASHNCMEDVPTEFNKWILSALALPIIQSSLGQFN